MRSEDLQTIRGQNCCSLVAFLSNVANSYWHTKHLSWTGDPESLKRAPHFLYFLQSS